MVARSESEVSGRLAATSPNLEHQETSNGGEEARLELFCCQNSENAPTYFQKRDRFCYLDVSKL